jgi:hypothetical protein
VVPEVVLQDEVVTGNTLVGVVVVVVLKTFGCYSSPLATALIMDHFTQPSRRYQLRKYKFVSKAPSALPPKVSFYITLKKITYQGIYRQQKYHHTSATERRAQTHLLVMESRRLVTGLCKYSARYAGVPLSGLARRSPSEFPFQLSALSA